MRLFRWFFTKKTPDLGGCRTCDSTLMACPRCRGNYSSLACTYCTTGAVCPSHNRFRY